MRREFGMFLALSAVLAVGMSGCGKSDATGGNAQAPLRR